MGDILKRSSTFLVGFEVLAERWNFVLPFDVSSPQRLKVGSESEDLI